MGTKRRAGAGGSGDAGAIEPSAPVVARLLEASARAGRGGSLLDLELGALLDELQPSRRTYESTALAGAIESCVADGRSSLGNAAHEREGVASFGWAA